MTLYESLLALFTRMKFSPLVADDLAERASDVANEWYASNNRAVDDGHVFQAMCDLEWHGAGQPIIWTRGTHVQWTEVVVGKYAFNIDDQQDRKRLTDWGNAMRARVANASLPEPEPRVE